MTAILSLIGCILIMISAAMFAVRIAWWAVKFLYKIAPIIMVLGLTAAALFYVENCREVKNAKHPRSTQTQSGSSQNGEQWHHLKVLPSSTARS